MKRPELREERDPLQDSGVFRKRAFEPAECLFLVAERDVDGRDGWSRYVSCLALAHELVENLMGLSWPAHTDVGDGKTSTRQMPDVLCLGIKIDRLRKISIFSI